MPTTTLHPAKVAFTDDEKDVLTALTTLGPQGTRAAIRTGTADTAVRILEGAAALIARLQAIQVESIAHIDRLRDASRGGLAEVALSLSVTAQHARTLIAAARSLTTRLPRTLGLMDAGLLDWYRASKVVDATDWLSTHHAAIVDDELATRLAGKNATQVRKAACHAAMKTDPDGAGRRTEHRRAGRRIELEHHGDGASTLSIEDGPVEKVTAAYTRIDRAARALKTRHEPRTLDQLRADIALDLLLGPTQGSSGVRAEVFLYMDLTTYLGLTNTPAELAGNGHIPAELAQHIATGPDTVLRRIITDPLTGHVMELGRTRYRPTAAIDEYVRVRDRECRGIGCSRPAQSCDLDHHTDWNHGGPTNTTDLITYCRTHHKLKDQPGWNHTLTTNGTLIVTTPTGRTHTSHPNPLHEPRPLPTNDHNNTPPPF